MTLDDPEAERLIRTLADVFYETIKRNMNEDRPIYTIKAEM